jgi:hypothetical protein
MSTAIRTSLIAAAFGLSTLAASAQSQQTQPPVTPPAAPGTAQTIPEKTPSSPGTNGASGNLSEKLDRSDGVIKPPDHVDPSMAKQAPATPQTMPVIKPPEEKGGPVAK